MMNDILSDFEYVVTSILGVYLNTIGGYRLCLKELIANQEKQLRQLRRTNPKLASVEFLDSTPGQYSEGNPNIPGAKVLFECSLGEHKKRNSSGGLNYRIIGNMCVIVIYQYWEDYFRVEIARNLGREKNDISSDIMGDLNLLRRSIIHHRSVALKEIENCRLLRWFKEGDEIFIDEDKFKDIVSYIKAFIQTMR